MGLERAKQTALEEARNAIEAVKVLEPDAGPLAALALYAVERTS
jgi:hypothetical protein